MIKTGIYKITNIINNKVYIGGALCLRTRLNKHFSDLKLNKHHSKKLQNSYNKYGKDFFNKEILEYCSKEQLNEREQFWMNKLNCIKNGYNILPLARRPVGYKHTDAAKAKISAVHKGKTIKQHAKDAVAKANSSRLWSEESKLKSSLSKQGIKYGPMSDEHKAKIIASRKANKALKQELIHGQEYA